MSNTNISSQSDAASADQVSALPEGQLSSGALARRRMLLKSLSRGSAVVAAAAVPMHTLASTGTITSVGKNGAPAVRCGISGMMSGVHSRETFTQVCSGYSPGKYKKIRNWPKYDSKSGIATNSVNGISFTQTTTFAEIFGNGMNKGLLDIMQNHPSYDEFHWTCALLNAVGGAPASFAFPYTASEVVALYKGMGGSPYSRDDALQFFKTYMENL